MRFHFKYTYVNKYTVRLHQVYRPNPAFRKLIVGVRFGKHAEDKANPKLVKLVGRTPLTWTDFRGPQWEKVGYLWSSPLELTKAAFLCIYSQHKPELP